MNSMIIFWFVVLILMIVLEIITINLVSIWFAIGAFVSCVVAYFTDNYIIQIIVFLSVSVAMLLLIKPFTKKLKYGSNEKVNLDRIIGMKGVVTEAIEKNKIGEVKVDGKLWSAISTENINKDEIVKIEKIEGVKLIVKKEE